MTVEVLLKLLVGVVDVELLEVVGLSREDSEQKAKVTRVQRHLEERLQLRSKTRPEDNQTSSTITPPTPT